jgi:hypothetical protein
VAVLAAHGLDVEDAGDLGDGVGVVGGLERAGQQRGLGHRLPRQLGVDAGRAEQQEPLDADSVGGLEHIDLDAQVVAEEVSRVGVVGQDAADLGRGEHDDLRPVCLEERARGCLVSQVQVDGRRSQKAPESLPLEVPPHRGADEASMAGYVDRRFSIELTLRHIQRL